MTEEEREELERLQLEELRYQNRRRKANQKINKVYLIAVLVGIIIVVLAIGIEFIKLIIEGLTQYY